MLPQFLHTHTFKIIALIATIFPFVGYLIGYSYYSGYMHAYGLMASDFPLSMPEIYYHTYIGVGDAFLYPIVFLSKQETIFKYFIIILFTCITSILCYLLKNRKIVAEIFMKYLDKIMLKIFGRLIAKSKRDDKFRLKLHSFLDKTDKVGDYLQYSVIILLIIEVLLMCLLIYWLPTSIFYQLGKDKAINNIQSFIKNDCNKKPNQNLGSCISILDENKKMIYKGVLIAHNLQNDRLAIMQKNEISIIQLKPDYVITRAYFYADKPNPNPSK